MKQTLLFAAMLPLSLCAYTQDFDAQEKKSGTLSLGTRNTVSLFNEDGALGKGIGGQFRLQFGKRLNSEWFFDYITSTNEPYTYRNDYHIGWSLMLYTRNNYDFGRLLQPYFIVGHCFDYSKVAALGDKANAVSRLSMATQTGLGTHINITSKLDCSVSGQYMMHLGKDIATTTDGDKVTIAREDHSHFDGHLLFP